MDKSAAISEDDGLLNNEISRTPPHNFEAEQSLLGAILVKNSVYGMVADRLGAEHFAEPLHARIYEEMGARLDNGKTATPVTITFPWSDIPTGTNTLGGYLARLAVSVITTINAREYAETIIDCAMRRRLIDIARAVETDAFDGISAKTTIEDLEAELFTFGAMDAQAARTVSMSKAVEDAIEHAERAYKRGGPSGYPTGLLDLDKRLGGLEAGDLCVIGGRPGMGKTALLSTIASNMARADTPIPSAVFSMEMQAFQLGHREIARITGISVERQRRGALSPEEWAAMADAGRQAKALPIYIDETPARSLATIRRETRRLIRTRGVKIIFIDHLQIMRQGGRAENRRLEIGEITNGAKAMAKDLGIPVVLLSQLSRALEQREDKRPIMSDLRETGDIEQDADIIMFVYRDEYYLKQNEPSTAKLGEPDDKFSKRRAEWTAKLSASAGVAEIVVAKQRQGTSGIVRCKWDGMRQRFENLADPAQYQDYMEGF